jgi:hypothetical protein
MVSQYCPKWLLDIFLPPASIAPPTAQWLVRTDSCLLFINERLLIIKRSFFVNTCRPADKKKGQAVITCCI